MRVSLLTCGPFEEKNLNEPFRFKEDVMNVGLPASYENPSGIFICMRVAREHHVRFLANRR
jgi:hypothetical protein